jgi:membrane glycosyltransferase
MPQEHITDIARTIQLAVAPVFLLTALGTILGVLTSRLSRVVDRARVLVARPPDAPRDSFAPEDELVMLNRRRKLVNAAITCATVAALLVCLVIASAFIAFMLERDLSVWMALLFIGAMASFIAALLLFLREIVLTVSTLRITR